MFEAGYLKLFKDGKLHSKVEEAYKLMEKCSLCARNCGVNRLKDEKKFCATGITPVVSSYGPHFGEESPLVGRHGSGTIFLTNCNLGCIFCQNYDISHLSQGEPASIDSIAGMMISLKRRGCNNINFVTPTHQMPMLLEALEKSIPKGLNVPVVWNCGGYESMEALKILDGIVDIYMPDFKYWDSEPAMKYSSAKNYPEVARAAIKEMHRQVGDLKLDKEGIATRGLLVRHLVMPDNISGTKDFTWWLSKEVSPATYLNIMDQYHPCHEAHKFPEINRRITKEEYAQALKWAKEAGLKRLDQEVAPRRRMFII